MVKYRESWLRGTGIKWLHFRCIITSGYDWLTFSSTILNNCIFQFLEHVKLMWWKGESNLKSNPYPWVWTYVPVLEESNKGCETYLNLLSLSTDGFGPLVLVLHLSQTMTEACQQAAVCLICATGNLLSVTNQPQAHQTCEEARRGGIERKQSRKRRKLALSNTCCICHGWWNPYTDICGEISHPSIEANPGMKSRRVCGCSCPRY